MTITTPTSPTAPTPLFDSLEHINNQSSTITHAFNKATTDYQHALKFLQSYTGSRGTFNSYRREIERVLHWSWLIAKKSLIELSREDIEAYLYYCQKPPQSWIGTKKAPRFLQSNNKRIPNPEWRPFVITLPKAALRRGQELDIKQFSLSQGALRETLAILSSFFNFLLQEQYTTINPVALIRQKSKFLRKQQGSHKIRRLSPIQWETVIQTARRMADENPERYERTLFIMSALYSMYLRISELTASDRWIPTMNDFYKDHDELWWFTTVGKGNKERRIAVSDAMLIALKRWRAHCNLSSFPTPADDTPMIPKTRGVGPISSTNYVRRIVQSCFDAAIETLEQDGFADEAESLNEATVHWLRHTGISDDVKIRPREHVRDDAGHSSSAITDKYIDIGLRERHESAKRKPISEDD